MIIRQLFLCTVAFLLYKAEGHKEVYPLNCGPKHPNNKPKVVEVPSYDRPWSLHHLNYRPKYWNETCHFRECDPEVRSFGFYPNFNKIDGHVNRKRVKACGEHFTYDVEDGFPLNPAGRTGLTGRGMLPRYGPNRMMSVIFVWETKDKVLILKKSAKNSYEDAFITGYISDPEDQPFADLPLKYITKSLRREYGDDKVKKILKNARKRFVKLAGGNVPSSLETDHAWVELEMFLVPCKKTKKLCTFGLARMQEKFGFQWHEMRSENQQALNQSIKSLIDSRRDNQEGYSVFCEGHKKKKHILPIIFTGIVLIGAASGAVALAVAFAAASYILLGVGIFFAVCLLGTGLFVLGAGLHGKHIE